MEKLKSFYAKEQRRQFKAKIGPLPERRRNWQSLAPYVLPTRERTIGDNH